MSEQVFLRLYGENGSKQRVVFEASLDGSTIRKKVCNRVTGGAESGQVTYFRITFFHPDNGIPLTTFGLLKDRDPVVLDQAHNQLVLSLRVRCFLAAPNAEALARIEGQIKVRSTGGKHLPIFSRLTATFDDTVYEQPDKPGRRGTDFLLAGSDVVEFALTEMASRSVLANPRSSTNLLKQALGVKPSPTSSSLLQVAFFPVGDGRGGQVSLVFSQSMIIGGKPSLDFRDHPLSLRGGSRWQFLQKAPTPASKDEAREMESLANRWTAEVIPGATATTPDLLGIWNQAIANPYHRALRTIQGGRAISLLPQFDDGAPEIPVHLFYDIREDQPEKKKLHVDDNHPETGDFALLDRKVNPPSPEVFLSVHSLQPAAQVSALSQLKSLRTHDGKPLQVSWRIVPPERPESAEPGLTLEAFFLGVPSPGPDQGSVRLGSLDLTFQAASATGAPSTDRSSLNGDILPAFPGVPSGLPYTNSLLRLTASAVAPGGQDPLPEEQFVQNLPEEFGNRRQPPVLIPLEGPESRKLELRAVEKTTASSSQTLIMQLFDRDQEQHTSSRNVVVIDRQPFLVAKVSVPSFQGSAETSEIGNWSGGSPHGASWELNSRSGIAGGFVLELPPQGVGEAMEKTSTPGEDIDQDQPADFRFTPPAHFELQASFFKQRFAEAPWNLRRILGSPGDRAPGAGIDKLEFEMLYGLGCEVEHPFLRLAEISSRLGAIPGDVPKSLPWPATTEQKGIHAAFRAGWADTFASYFSRLAVLEPWDDHQPLELTLDDGVRYELRRSAHLRYPIPGEKLPEELEGKIPAEDDGLAGGVAWGFESANVYHATWRDPKSTSGKLVRPYFSALGGWGFQKASFDHDRTTFYADAAMGRTFFLSLERIGRIGVLWNVAKHVIIYERTVAPTEQFAGRQDHHAGRPLLRKVKEFVEILQPARGYPESSTTPKVTRGFVVGSEFKSRIINVDSAWGHDVGTIGWQVPLWRPDEAAAHPTVYPKPHILLEVGADPGGGSDTIKLEIDEPQKLVFYTDTREETDARTDLWPAIEGIDYLDRPAPRPPVIPGHAGSDLDRSLPDAPAVEAGFDALTWAVLPAERGANLVVDRTDQPLAAVIRNVTMMRAQAQEKEKIPDVVKDIARLADPFEDFLQRILTRVPTTGQVSPGLLDRLKREVETAEVIAPLRGLRTKLDELGKKEEILKILSSSGGLCKELTERSGRELDRLAEQVAILRSALRNDLAALLNSLRKQDETLRVEARRFVKDEIEKLRRILRLAQAGLDLVTDRIAAVERDLDQLAARTTAEIDGYLRLVDDVERTAALELDRLRRELRELRSRMIALVREADSRLAKISEPRFAKIAVEVRDLLAKAQTEIEKVLGEVEKVLSAASPNLNDVRTPLRTFRAKIHDLFTLSGNVIAAARKIPEDLTAALKEIQDALNEAEKQAVDAIDRFSGGVVGDLIEELDGALEKAFKAFLTPEGKLDPNLRARVTDAVSAACGKILHGVKELFDEVAGSLGDNAQGAIDRIKAVLGTIQPGTGVEEIRRALDRTVEGLRRQLAPLADQLQDGLREISGAVSQLGDSVLRLVRAFGDAPSVPNLGFNRRQIAYFFDELAKAVDLTPVTALVNRVGDELKALGMRIPTRQLLDRILPDSLENFDLSKLLPDFSGLKLDNLFPGLKMPRIANDKVKVTHGIDPETRRAWMQADVDVPIDQPSDLFSTGPVAVRLLKARFKAQARIEASLNGPPRQTTNGEIRGDGQISVASMPIVLFRETALIFEDGRVRFDLSPEKIELTAALRFLSDLMKKIGYSEGGFSIKLLEEGGLPVGVESVLDLPLPDITAGAFAITSLRLGSTFSLRIEPKTFDFTLATRFHLGTKEAPFALAIWVLAGGGWLDANARYTPRTGAIETSVSIGIVAGGSLVFSFGPVHGGVQIFFGIEAEFVSRTGSAQTLNVAILLLVRGEVQVLGFLSVGLHLLLQAQYQQNGRLIGTGNLSIEIKVCRFFTVKVSTSVRYEFAKGSGGGGAAQQNLAAPAPGEPIRQAAQDYVGMLE